MAYIVKLNNKLFFDTAIQDDSILLSQASVLISATGAGSFDFTIPNTHKDYDNLHRLTDYVDVYRDDELIWAGRIYSIEDRYDTQKAVGCEGLLCILADSIFRPIVFDGQLRNLVSDILDNHNEQVEAAKQIRLGRFTVENSDIYRGFENYETSISRLQDLVKSFGGYMMVRKENGQLYLDWLDHFTEACTQEIELTSNLIDIKKVQDSNDIFTVLIPLGADDGAGRLTIRTVNDNRDYIEADAATISEYGRIVHSQIWNDVHYANILKTKAQNYLQAALTPKVQIYLTAVDLADAGYDVDSFRVGKMITVTSKPHGLDAAQFACTQQKLNLLDPSQNRLEMGEVRVGYMESQRSNSAEKILETVTLKIEKAKGILEDEIAGATALITGNEGGYVVVHDSDGDTLPDEILIMDTPDIDTAVKVWRWNNSGLGYSSTGYNGTYGLAMTINGAIVADYITTGTLSAERVKAGILRGITGSSYWNLETGELYVHGYATTENVNALVQNLQSQIDGNIQSWSGTAAPTLSNYPANQWTTTDERLTHVGDIYYDGNGKCYRFAYENNTFQWKLISDTEISKALSDAAEALEGIADINGLLVSDYYTKTQTDTQISAAEGRLTSTMQSDYTSLVAFKSGAANNLLPYPYYHTTRTVNGITWTDNGDGTVTANGTLTDTESSFNCKSYVQTSEQLFLSAGNYVMSGCPEGGSNNSYRIYVRDTNRNIGYDIGDGLAFSIADSSLQIGIYLQVRGQGTTVNNLTFRPMLERGSVAHDYVSYADSIGGVQASVETTDNKVSTLEQTVEGFKTEVSETYSTKTETKNAVDSVQIGGRNLLYDTNAPHFGAIDGDGNRYISDVASLLDNGEGTGIVAISDSPVAGIRYGMHHVCTATGGAGHRMGFYSGYGKIDWKDGETYTASMWVKSSVANARIGIGITNGSRMTLISGAYEQTITEANKWQRVSVTFRFNGAQESTTTLNNKTTYSNILYMGYLYNLVGEVWCCGYKLETGTRATDWTEYVPEGNPYGGANILQNTLAIDNSSLATRININGFYNDGEHYGNIESSESPNMQWDAVKHGVKFTALKNEYHPYCRFGTSTTNASHITRAEGLFGLTAGQTYTLSFDVKCKLYSGLDNTEQAWYALTAYYYDDVANTAGWTLNQAKHLILYNPKEYGTEKTARCFFTFTIQPTAKRFYLIVRANNTTTPWFRTNDYLELSNMKLEEGSYPTSWTASQAEYSSTKEVESKIEQKADSITASVASNYTSKAEYKTGGADNLIAYPYYRPDTREYRGITYTVNADGSVTANGTATGGRSFYEFRQRNETGNPLILPKGTHTVSGCPSGGGTSSYFIGVNSTHNGSEYIHARDYGDGNTFTIDTEHDGEQFGVFVQIADGTTVNNLTFYPMLERGSIAHNYVSYAESKAKNQTVTDIEERVSAAELKITDSAIVSTVMESETYTQSTNVINLLPSVYYRENESGTSWTNNGITWTVNKDGSITANGTATADSNFALNEYKDSYSVPIMRLDTTKKYNLHGCPSGGSSSTYFLRCCQRADATSGTASSNHYDYGNGVTITPTTGFANFYCGVKSGTTVSNIKFYPMLEVGTIKHSYVSTHDGTGALVTRMQSAESSITQNANNIALKVSETDYNGNTIASLINQSATTVAINAGKINLNGAVTANNYFKINTNGSMECINGVIGGWNIGENAIYKDNGDYRAYIQIPYYQNNSSSWVFSTQYKKNGQYYASFYVTTYGDIYFRHNVTFGASESRNTGAIKMWQTLDTYEGVNLYNNSGLLVTGNTTCNGTISAGKTVSTGTSASVPGTVTIKYGGLNINNNGSYASGQNGLYGNCDAYFVGTVGWGSDLRLKRDIKSLNREKSAGFIYSLDPIEYRLIEGDVKKHHGFGAQPLEKILSRIDGYENWGVVINPDSENEEDYRRYKAIAYTELIADLVATVQSQNERIKALEQATA